MADRVCQRLLRDAAPDTILRRRLWTDPASIDLPLFYANTGAMLAAALEVQGDSVAARRVADRAQEIAAALGVNVR